MPTVRWAIVFLGCVGIGWGIALISAWRGPAVIEKIGTRIIAGEAFNPNLLVALRPMLDQVEKQELCRPALIRSAAVVRLRLLDEAVARGERDAIDERTNALLKSLHLALICAPTDSFLWLMLYWNKVTQDGFSSKYVNYLSMSYRRGPNEGWIALKRNRLAISVFSQLPSDVADMAVREFAELVDHGAYLEAAATLAGPGWGMRERLLGALSDISERHREKFQRALDREGLKVIVPGVPANDPRPWRR